MRLTGTIQGKNQSGLWVMDKTEKERTNSYYIT